MKKVYELLVKLSDAIFFVEKWLLLVAVVAAVTPVAVTPSKLLPYVSNNESSCSHIRDVAFHLCLGDFYDQKKIHENQTTETRNDY